MNEFFYVPFFDWGYVSYPAVPVRIGGVSAGHFPAKMARWLAHKTGFD